MTLDNFFIAQKGPEIIAVAKLEEFDGFLFLSSVAVPFKFQKQGIASLFLKKLLKNRHKKIYIYTTIPEFFKKLGFIGTNPIPSLPSKNKLECEECNPSLCVCMVKLPK